MNQKIMNAFLDKWKTLNFSTSNRMPWDTQETATYIRYFEISSK